MTRRQIALLAVLGAVWALLMLMLDKPDYPTTYTEVMKESLKWGLP